MPERDAERRYDRCIRPDLLDGIARSRRQTAVLVVGGADADSAYALARVRANLDPVVGPSALVSPQALREYHPHWRAQPRPSTAEAIGPDIARWQARLISEAIERRLNLVVEVGTLDPDGLAALARRLKDEGYEVAGVALAPDREATRQAAIAQALLARAVGAATRVGDVVRDEAHEAMHAALSRLEADGVVDRMQIVARDGRHLYANEQAGGHWVAEPRAAYVLEDFEGRQPTARELADAALRWQALVRQLRMDSSLPGELLERASRHADAASARAEQDPDARRMLAWGDEAEAFRSLNRFAFLRAYPQHAKTVERLEEAIGYAEKQFEHASDRARFIDEARRRLADRIAEGRAPAAERGKPAPTREPRTR
jgi:hypothetical protein